MVREFALTNFKAFGDTVTIPIKPITLIFGPNSSGKSSIFQALLMLKQTLEDDVGKGASLLSKGSLVDLGSYTEFVYGHEVNRAFSFKVTVPSPRTVAQLQPFDDDLFLDELNPHTEAMLRAVNFASIGFAVTFGLREKAGVTVTGADLFLGDGPNPIVRYGNNSPDETVDDLITAYRETAEKNLPPGLRRWYVRTGLENMLIPTFIDSKHSYWSRHFSQLSDFYSAYTPYNLALWEVLYGDAARPFPDILLDFRNKPPHESRDLLTRLHLKGYERFSTVRNGTPHEELNGFLGVPNLYDLLVQAGEDLDWQALDRLLDETEPLRQKAFHQLTETEKLAVRRLNVIVLHAISSFGVSTNLETEPLATPTLINEFADDIFLSRFLPERIGFGEKRKIITTAYHSGGSDISLFSLCAADSFKLFLHNIQYIGPLRPPPERFYVFSGTRVAFVGSSGKHALDILVPHARLLSSVNQLLQHLGLDYELRVSELTNDFVGSGGLLSLNLRRISDGVVTGLADVGFGISQVLPIVVQSVLSREKTILIEQPELHLHPAQQAELGDVFIGSALGENRNTFLIETHSEHLILRLLRRIRETADGTLPEGARPVSPDDVAVLYVQPTESGSRVIHIPVTTDGEFEIPWPEGFFAERSKELF